MQDWRDFEQIIWGKTDGNDHIRDKYITVAKSNGGFNPTLVNSVKSRVGWIGNVTRHRCEQMFVLRNVSKADETTYGCTALVYGDRVRSGPINLAVYGKSHYKEDQITVCFAFNFALCHLSSVIFFVVKKNLRTTFETLFWCDRK